MRLEMQLHLDLETEANTRRGLSHAEARRLALVAFGGVVNAEEAVRDERGTRIIEQFAADVQYALRGARRHPVYAAAIAGLVALGVGSNTRSSASSIIN